MSTDRNFLIVLGCFVLSGTAGLIYQTAWLQLFALVFGSSELALATVLAAYMGGLALGAAAAGRWSWRLHNHIRTYAGLELAIGVSALLVPLAITGASQLQAAWMGGGDLPPEAGSLGSALFYLVCSFVILLVPTGFMGATLPLLAQWAVRSEEQIGRRVGLLYAANTLGAAVGAMAGAFFLLPRIGLAATVWVAAAINGLVFLLAMLLTRSPSALPPAPRVDVSSLDVSRRWILPAVMISGGVSFTWEILWTRLLSQLIGGSMYSFATMLATMLVGLTIGSAVASWLARSSQRARLGFGVSQGAIGAFSLAAFVGIDRLPAWAESLAHQGVNAFTSGALLSSATLLPGAIAIGATFPFAVRYLASEPSQSSLASARVFAWNTAGAIAGSLLAGYWILPRLGFAATATVAVATSLLLALWAAAADSPRRWLLAAVAMLGALGLLGPFNPPTPWRALRYGPLAQNQWSGDVAFHAVGRSANVMLYKKPWGWSLVTNGLPEAGIANASGRAGSLSLTRWMSLLPIAARPETRSLLVVGLGAGVTVEEVPKSVDAIHVIEIEPEVIDANRRVSTARRKDPLADPRVSLHVNDARGALRLTGAQFDAITSQPSHPWTSGAANLFTREFLELVRTRLTPSGVFVQWMGLSFVDEALLRSWVATAADTFPYVELYKAGPGGVLLLASGQPIDMERSSGLAIRRDPTAWARHGILYPEDVLAIRVLDDPGVRHFVGETAPITDLHNDFRVRAPTVLRGRALGGARAELVWESSLPKVSSWGAGVDTRYLLRRLIRQGDLQRVRNLAHRLEEPQLRHTFLGLAALQAGDRDEAEFHLRSALRLDPVLLDAKVGLLALHRGDLVAGRTVEWEERFPEDPERAVLEGWQATSKDDWVQLRDLEVRLQRVDSRHPLFLAAVRLRATWRIGQGGAVAAGEAVDLIEPLLSPFPQVADLMLRARAAAVAGDPALALASLEEALASLVRGSQQAAEWHQILRALPNLEETAAWRLELEERYRRPRLRVGG